MALMKMSPKITIGVVAYEEEETIGEALQRIVEQISGDAYEVLVVAGGRDRTLEIVKSFAREHPELIRVFEEKERRGKPAAVNTIVENARGEIVVLTDGDVFLEAGSVEALISAFNDERVGLACGRPVPLNDRNSLFGFWAHYLYQVAHEKRLEKSSAEKPFSPTGYLLAIRKEAFSPIPSEALADDAYLGMLVSRRGYLLRYEPKARVLVRFPETISDFLRQKRRTFGGFVQVKGAFGQADRDVLKEALEGVPKGLRYCRSFRELGFFAVLCLVRLLTWIAAWRDVRRKRLAEIWVPAKSTKRMWRVRSGVEKSG